MKGNFRTMAGGLLGILLLALPLVMDIEGLNLAGRISLGIFLMAGCFWILEPIPIYTTSLLIIFLQVLLLSDQGFIDFARVSGYEAENYRTFYATLSNPIIILFLGGFTLARAAVKFGLDQALTRALLKPFGTSPARVCLGMMLSTAVLSAFMSNTATTAMMMTLVVPIIMGMEENDPFKTGIALSIPVAANIGGVATPIGTPPNAIVISALREQGIYITFSTWMILALPLVIVMLLLGWRILLFLFPPATDKLKIDFSGKTEWTLQAKLAATVFGLTVLLWITEKLHGIASTVVAFLPIVILPALGILDRSDIRRYSWDVLWLVAGGISLGISLQSTGLAHWMINLVPWQSMGVWLMILIFAIVAYCLANLVSNTVTATILVPLIIGLSASGLMEQDIPLAPATVLVGVIVSFSMMLPISTPPNAIAMSTGLIKTPDMAKVGIVAGMFALFLCGLCYFFYWPIII